MSKLIGKSVAIAVAPLHFQYLIEIAIDDFVLARVCFVLYLMADELLWRANYDKGEMMSVWTVVGVLLIVLLIIVIAKLLRN